MAPAIVSSRIQYVLGCADQVLDKLSALCGNYMAFNVGEHLHAPKTCCKQRPGSAKPDSAVAGAPGSAVHFSRSHTGVQGVVECSSEAGKTGLTADAAQAKAFWRMASRP